MAAKPLDVIVGQPTTQSMDYMMEQMAKMVAAVETRAWGGLYSCLVLVLDDIEYKRVTTDSQLETAIEDKLASIASTIDGGHPPTRFQETL